jgi:hypothetical protein
MDDESLPALLPVLLLGMLLLLPAVLVLVVAVVMRLRLLLLLPAVLVLRVSISQDEVV